MDERGTLLVLVAEGKREGVELEERVAVAQGVGVRDADTEEDALGLSVVDKEGVGERRLPRTEAVWAKEKVGVLVREGVVVEVPLVEELETNEAVPTLTVAVVEGVTVWQDEEDMEVVMVTVVVRVTTEVGETEPVEVKGFEGEWDVVRVAEMVPVTEMVEDTETMVVEVEEGVTAFREAVGERVAVTVVE